MATTSLVGAILNWLRAGYPERAAGSRRVPLLALLRATPLTDEQLAEVVRNITAEGSAAVVNGAIDTGAIAGFITDVTGHDAGPENIKRAAAALAAAGWPLTGVDDTAV